MSVDRSKVAGQLAELLSDWGAGDAHDLERRFASLMADLGDEQIEESVARLAHTGETWGFHPHDELARRLSRDLVPVIVLPDTTISGIEQLEACRKTSAVFVGNHLSFIDVNVLDGLVARAGYADVVDRMTALVGPKVFSLPIRRLASLCFGTVKLPQSSSRASGEAAMSQREVAKLAVQTIRVARQRQQEGDHLLVFPEGMRSRNAQLQRLLAAVSRYLEHEPGVVIPFGHSGTERLVPLDEDHVYPTTVSFRMGAPVPVRLLRERCGRDRALIADVVGFLIADLIPEKYRGVYSGSDPELQEARDIASALADH